jgi:aspartate racemase
MTTLGLIGGMTWHSTLEYYRVINERVAAERGGHASAHLLMESMDFAEVRRCQVDDDWAGAGRLLADAARRLEAAGADTVLLCTNLMHRVADDVDAAVDVPLLHIGDAIADRARQHGWTRVGVLGTSWVMEEGFYLDRLSRTGLRPLVPDAADRADADRIIFDELTTGRVEDVSRRAYVEIIGRLRDAGAEAVVLACTEIGLLVGPDDSPLPLLDSMRVHAEAAADLALDGSGGERSG